MKQLALGVVVLTTFLPSVILSFNCEFSPSHLEYHNVTNLKQSLQHQILGPVLAPWDDKYEQFRSIHNQACCQKPLLIARPRSQKDVSRAVLFSVQYNLPLSVRSGGHSYTCQSLKHGGLHLDLRLLAIVKLIRTKESKTGLSAVLGTGNTWANVLKIIPPTKYTVIHGQCLTVGVGGYLLGGGVNALGASARFGFGAQNVIKMKGVLADGSMATITKEKVVVRKNGVTRTIFMTEDTDLWFGLRGAGSSFAIITEFHVTVYPRPETLPLVIPITVSSVQDLANIEAAAAADPKWLISVYSYRRYYDGIFPYNLLPYNYPGNTVFGVSGKHIALLSKVQRLIGGSGSVNPVFIVVTQVKGEVGRFTPVEPAVNHLKRFGVKLAFEIPKLINFFSGFAGYLTVNTYEDGFLTVPEQRIIGPLNVVAAAMWGMKDSTEFSKVFLHHPIFGQSSKMSQKQIMQATGCDFCWFSFYYENHFRFRNHTAERVSLPPPRELGPFMWDFSCLFRDRNSRCPARVRQLKEDLSLNTAVVKVSQFQYGNTPSCEKIDFGKRYWGSNYPRLLKIKQAWDPGNVFNHCQSVGSTEQNCCPY